MKLTDVAFWSFSKNTNVASYRLRCLNVINGLQKMNIDATIYRHDVIPKILILSKRYDEKSLNKAIELREKYQTKIALDLCDNHFYNGKNNPAYEIKKQELLNAINSVDFIISSTDALKNEIEKYLNVNTKIHVIGDTVEKPTYEKNIYSLNYWKGYWSAAKFRKAIHSINKNYRLVWFGNHGSLNADSGMESLRTIIDSLEILSKEYPISLTIISNSKAKYKSLFQDVSFKTFYVEWNRYFFSEIFQLHSTSVIPIHLNPFTICKTNNRVATSIMHGLAVCCNCIPAYAKIIDCISEDEDWMPLLKKYLDPLQRQIQIENSIKKINQGFSEKMIFTLWYETLLNEKKL